MGTNYYLRLKASYGSDLIKNFPAPEYRNLEVQELENGYVWKNKYYPMLSDLNSEYYFSLHIGKDSAGWNFGLRGIPSAHLMSLNDWKQLFDLPNAEIYDEYDRPISVEQMLELITEKSAFHWDKYKSREAYEQHVVDTWNIGYEKERKNTQPDYGFKLYSRPVKDYDDYLQLRDCWGPNGAVRGARGLIGRVGTSGHEVIHIDGASYDISVEDDNYGW